MIKISRNCNLHITFENGVTVSILIGGGSYSDNHDMPIGHEQEAKHISSTTAEIAAWNETGEWLTKNLCPDSSDNVLGWQTPAHILDFLVKASKYKHSGINTGKGEGN